MGGDGEHRTGSIRRGGRQGPGHIRARAGQPDRRGRARVGRGGDGRPVRDIRRKRDRTRRLANIGERLLGLCRHRRGGNLGRENRVGVSGRGDHDLRRRGEREASERRCFFQRAGA